MTDTLTREEALAILATGDTVQDSASAQIALARLPPKKITPREWSYDRRGVEALAEYRKAEQMSRALSKGAATGFEDLNTLSRLGERIYGPGLQVGDLAHVNKYGNAIIGEDPQGYCSTARVSDVDKDGWVLLEAEAEDDGVPF